MSYDLGFIGQVLYTLKREFGMPLNIVWRESSVANLETGVKTVVSDSFSVKSAIVLPMSTQNSFIYDLSFIAASKNFTYGGIFNQNRRRVVIDRSDLSDDFKIKIGYYLVIGGDRFEVEKIDNYIVADAVVLETKQVDNIELNNVLNSQAVSFIPFRQTVEVLID